MNFGVNCHVGLEDNQVSLKRRDNPLFIEALHSSFYTQLSLKSTSKKRAKRTKRRERRGLQGNRDKKTKQ